MVDLKEKIGYLKKIQVWYFYHSVVLFFKNLSEESRPLFWVQLLERSAPAGPLEVARGRQKSEISSMY